MTHDPYQTYQTVGAHSGLMNPFSSPFSGMQTSANNPLAAAFGAYPGVPATFGQPFAPQGYQGFSGIPNYGGISPQQLQLASALASQLAQINAQSPFNNPWQTPFSGGFQHPFANAGQQNPIQQNPLLQNPWQVAAQLNPQLNPQANPMFNPALAQLAATLAPQLGLQAYSPYAQQQPYQQQPYQQQPYQQQPYQQTGFAQTQLAPQSWVGQGLTGQGFAGQGFAGQGQGQIHPLILQTLARSVQNQGITPWGAF